MTDAEKIQELLVREDLHSQAFRIHHLADALEDLVHELSDPSSKGHMDPAHKRASAIAGVLVELSGQLEEGLR